MRQQDCEDLILILTFAKTKLDKNNNSHQNIAKKIEVLINKIYELEKDLNKRINQGE